MKTYEEVAKSVFEKSEKYFEEKAVRARRIKTAATAMSCFCLAAVITVGAIAVLNGNLTENPIGGLSEGQLANDAENEVNTPSGDNKNDGIAPETTTTADYPGETTADTADTESPITAPDSTTDGNQFPTVTDDDVAGAWGVSGSTFPDGSFFGTSSDPNLPINTLTGVTPKDTDQILAAAQSVSSEYYRSVFVLAETGSEVYSLVDGVVVMAEYNGISGYFIEVETTDGRHIRHSHLSEMLAAEGDTVTKDQVIGLAGTTGYASYSGVGYVCI